MANLIIALAADIWRPRAIASASRHVANTRLRLLYAGLVCFGACKILYGARSFTDTPSPQASDAAINTIASLRWPFSALISCKRDLFDLMLSLSLESLPPRASVLREIVCLMRISQHYNDYFKMFSGPR